VKRLGLLRHAKSQWDDLALRDFDRGLNARGRRGAALMGRHIRDSGQAWDMIVASPAERVKLTLAASGLAPAITWDRHLYLADAATLLQCVRGLPTDRDAVMLVGHNPGLQDLLLMLADPTGDMIGEAAEKFPTASYAVLELAIERWSDCSPGCGRLIEFARPRDLDPELGPEG